MRTIENDDSTDELVIVQIPEEDLESLEQQEKEEENKDNVNREQEDNNWKVENE